MIEFVFISDALLADLQNTVVSDHTSGYGSLNAPRPHHERVEVKTVNICILLKYKNIKMYILKILILKI